MIVASLKIGNVLSSLNLVLPALSAVLPLSLFSLLHNRFLFFLLIEAVCCTYAARQKQKEIYIVHLLSTAH